ncbi:MAG TPA: FlgO family outer membrane protein [Desulfurivibrionaceae bacterium]|jgi:TolB-like protein
MKKTRKRVTGFGVSLLLGWALLLAGCVPPATTGGTASVVTPDFFGVGEELALQLTSGMRGARGGQRLILTTVVDLDNLYTTTRFGRTLTEALSTSLFRHGFGVVEIRKSAELLIRDNRGELMLTRDAKLLAKQQQAAAILTGTYSLTPTTVILNLRLLDAGSQQVLSVAGLELQRSRNINHLLAVGGGALGDALLSGQER